MEKKQLPIVKRTFTDADKSLSINTLNLSEESLKRLEERNINTLGDLLNTNVDDLVHIFNDNRDVFFYIREMFHQRGVCLKDEFADLNISDEVALIPIENLDLSIKVKNSLLRRNIKLFGKLLYFTPDDLLKVRNFGTACLKEVKSYLNLFGYSLKDDAPTTKEKREKLKQEGAHLLEEIFSNQVYSLLYSKGIYTIEDLQNYGPDVYNFVGMGPARTKELQEKMAKYNIQFNIAEGKNIIPINEDTSNDKVEKTNKLIAATQKENEEIRTRIEKKEALILEYERLIQERKELLAREQELDALISTKLDDLHEIKDGVIHGRK